MPNVARVYHTLLDGRKDSFAADRRLADAVARLAPWFTTAAKANRKFLARAVQELVEDGGIRQIVDVGSGPPADLNAYDVAQKIAPDVQVVCVDHDPIVVTHLRALLASGNKKVTAFEGDLRQPEKILDNPELASSIDLSRPVAIVLGAVLHCLTEEDDPYRAVRLLVDAVVPGSYLVISHALDTPATRTVAELYHANGLQGDVRNADQIGRFFDGLELLEPGLVGVSAWRPGPLDAEISVPIIGGVGRKPGPMQLRDGSGSLGPGQGAC